MSRTLLKSLPKISPVLDRRNTAYNRCSTCSSCMSVSEKFGIRILVSKVFKFLDIVSLYRDIYHHVQDCSMHEQEFRTAVCYAGMGAKAGINMAIPRGSGLPGCLRK